MVLMWGNTFSGETYRGLRKAPVSAPTESIPTRDVWQPALALLQIRILRPGGRCPCGKRAPYVQVSPKARAFNSRGHRTRLPCPCVPIPGVDDTKIFGSDSDTDTLSNTGPIPIPWMGTIRFRYRFQAPRNRRLRTDSDSIADPC